MRRLNKRCGKHKFYNAMHHLSRLLIITALCATSLGCSTVIKQLDSTWADDRTVYPQPKLLPVLEAAPILVPARAQTQ
ncbi:MAG: hypothetical protein RL368_1063 [Pseudomonadota bacterium]|jgi:hypothetical protein